jgi:membrane fusion protein (multidrug efflux system)
MRADIKNPNLFLLPNMYVNIKLRLADNIATILLPSAALIQTQEKRSVWVVNQQHQVEMRSVEIAGEYQNNSIIKSGLKKGDVVIIKDVQKIQPGMNVTPLFSTPGLVLNG